MKSGKFFASYLFRPPHFSPFFLCILPASLYLCPPEWNKHTHRNCWRGLSRSSPSCLAWAERLPCVWCSICCASLWKNLTSWPMPSAPCAMTSSIARSAITSVTPMSAPSVRMPAVTSQPSVLWRTSRT